MDDSKPSQIKITNQKQNRRNSLIFSILMVPIQIVITTMHGVYIRVDQVDAMTASNYALIGLNILIPFIMALVIAVGFSLIFSYNRRLMFTGLGFCFFIFAFVIQFYPLVNAFWIKTKILSYSTVGFDNNSYPLYLGQYSAKTPYYNTIEGCFRCALSVMVSFSCILGRVGILQCLLTTIIGVIGYQLNRQICFQKFGNDVMGTMYIFTFGGFMGLTMGLLLKIRQRSAETQTLKNKNYTSGLKSSRFAYLGSLIIFFFLPFFGMGNQVNSSINKFTGYTVPISIFMSLSASFLGAISISLIIDNQLQIRTVIYGSIAGGITGGASSYFTSNVVYAILVGFIGGGTQAIIHNLFDKRLIKQNGPVATVSFSLFAVQGLIGSIFAAIYKSIIQSNSNDLIYTNLSYQSIKLFLFGLISALMGIAFGLLGFGSIILFTGYKKDDYFIDNTQWKISNKNGINNKMSMRSNDMTQIDRWSWQMVSIQY